MFSYHYSTCVTISEFFLSFLSDSSFFDSLVVGLAISVFLSSLSCIIEQATILRLLWFCITKCRNYLYVKMLQCKYIPLSKFLSWVPLNFSFVQILSPQAKCAYCPCIYWKLIYGPVLDSWRILELLNTKLVKLCWKYVSKHERHLQGFNIDILLNTFFQIISLKIWSLVTTTVCLILCLLTWN